MMQFDESEHLPLVRYCLKRVPASPGVDRDDLFQAGCLGLVEALQRFDGRPGVKFSSYALNRIRGAMRDEMREGDWLNRRQRKAVNALRGCLTVDEAQLRLGFDIRRRNLARQYLKLSWAKLVPITWDMDWPAPACCDVTDARLDAL